jgi:hypothetical protein
MKIYHGIKNLHDEIAALASYFYSPAKIGTPANSESVRCSYLCLTLRHAWLILIPTERSHEQNWFSKNQSKFHADKPDKTAGEIQTG